MPKLFDPQIQSLFTSNMHVNAATTKTPTNSVMNKHIGSSLNEFLSEQGILEDANNKAIRRVLSYQLNELMKNQNLSKSALANHLNTSESALDHLLDPDDDSVTLETLKNVAAAIGQRLEIRLVNG